MALFNRIRILKIWSIFFRLKFSSWTKKIRPLKWKLLCIRNVNKQWVQEDSFKVMNGNSWLNKSKDSRKKKTLFNKEWSYNFCKEKSIVSTKERKSKCKNHKNSNLWSINNLLKYSLWDKVSSAFHLPTRDSKSKSNYQNLQNRFREIQRKSSCRDSCRARQKKFKHCDR